MHKTHACIFFHSHSLSFGKSFPFPLILQKIPRLEMSCEHWQLSSFPRWGTYTMCSSGYSFPFLCRTLPSCTQWETQTDKMRWPTPLFLSLGTPWYTGGIFAPVGVSLWLQDRVDGCMLDGSTPFLVHGSSARQMSIFQRRKFVPNLSSYMFCKCFLEWNNKIIEECQKYLWGLVQQDRKC